MKIVFFGTPEASKLVLEKLAAGGYTPVAVVTNPDRPVGRKHVITPPPVKQWATEKGIAVFQPEKLGEIKADLAALEADLFIVAFYGKIIWKSILDIPKLGTLGIHPSLLPIYRGPSPVQTAILDGASEVGMTLYMMDEKMDEGPIFAQEKLETYRVGEKNNIELWHELAGMGGEMAVKLLPSLEAGNAVSQPQDHSKATYTKKFSTEDAFVSEEDLKKAQSGSDPEMAQKIHQKILAFTPEPGAWTTEGEKRVKLLGSKVENDRLILTLTQEEGKNPTTP